MGTSAEEEYAAFLEKVKRTIYVDTLSPLVTEPVLRHAFNQFGNVRSVHFIPVYLEQKNAPQAALVEMENPKQAREILTEMETYPFMILGMPRPVRASAARLEMFEDHPRKPQRKILCRWLDPKEPDFEVAKKVKSTVRKHAAEASIVLKVICLELVYTIVCYAFYSTLFVRKFLCENCRNKGRMKRNLQSSKARR